MDKKINVWMSPKCGENCSISINNSIWFTLYDPKEMFLINLANIIEMKNNNKEQEIKDNTIITLQNIKDNIQIKYWLLNEDNNIATAFVEMVIKQKNYNELYDMYSLFKMNKNYINKYINIIESDNFKYNELRRLFQNGCLILN